MYAYSILIGIKRTISLVEDTLQTEVHTEQQMATVHNIVQPLDTNMHDIFRQLSVCLNEVPFAFNRNANDEDIKTLLNLIYEKESVSVKQLPDYLLSILHDKDFYDTYDSNLVFNIKDPRVCYHIGRSLFELINDKLGMLCDALNRLTLRASTAPSENDELASDLIEEYVSTIDWYRELICLEIFVRSTIASSGVRSAGQMISAKPRDV